MAYSKPPPNQTERNNAGALVAGLDEDARSSLLERLVGCDAVREAVVSGGHVDVRRRVLTGEVTVKVVLGLGLFGGEGYDSVLAKVIPLLSGPLGPGAVPTGSALSQARARVDEKVFQALFQASAAEPGCGPVMGACEFGLELTAYDGTTFDLADTDAMREWFATPTGGRHPQARVVTLTACGTRKVRAAAVGSYVTSEQELVDTLVDALTPGTLNLADRNLCATWRFVAFPAQPGGTGGTFLDPMAYPDLKGNGDRSMPAKTGDRVQTDGAMRRGVRVIWLRLDCLNPNLQWRQDPARRKAVCNRRRSLCIRIKVARCSLWETDNVQRGRARR